MKVVVLISRLLLGLAFVVFGLNGFLHFIRQPPIPPGPMLDFMTAGITTHFFAPVFAVQLICGLLFLANVYVPLALTFIGPVIFNILVFHLTMDPKNIGPGILVTVLWFVVFYSVRSAFTGIFQAKAPNEA